MVDKTVNKFDLYFYMAFMLSFSHFYMFLQKTKILSSILRSYYVDYGLNKLKFSASYFKGKQFDI